MDWKSTVTDPLERKVLDALARPDVTWRTVGGVARQTHLTEAQVENILRRYAPAVARFSSTPSISGSALVGLVEKVGA